MAVTERLNYAETRSYVLSFIATCMFSYNVKPILIDIDVQMTNLGDLESRAACIAAAISMILD